MGFSNQVLGLLKIILQKKKQYGRKGAVNTDGTPVSAIFLHLFALGLKCI